MAMRGKSVAGSESRNPERDRAESHDSGDVELKGSRHRLPRTLSDHPNSSPPPGRVIAPNVLEASE